jgi:hypothetical protein
VSFLCGAVVCGGVGRVSRSGDRDTTGCGPYRAQDFFHRLGALRGEKFTVIGNVVE